MWNNVRAVFVKKKKSYGQLDENKIVHVCVFVFKC